jgi:hypothetical protein
LGAHPGTAPEFRGAVRRNAAFMRQEWHFTHDCRINAAFRGQCPDAPRPLWPHFGGLTTLPGFGEIAVGCLWEKE